MLSIIIFKIYDFLVYFRRVSRDLKNRYNDMAATNGKPFQPVNTNLQSHLLPFLKHSRSRHDIYLQDTDVNVTLDDQSKINKFANYNAKLDDLKDELVAKKNDLKSLEEALDEIELFDEDEQISYVVGEVFISYGLTKTQELLAHDVNKKKDEIKRIEAKCRNLKGLMGDLKDALYRRFGSNIYLESDE